MKGLIIASLVLVAGVARANPYFRQSFIDPQTHQLSLSNVQTVGGSFVDVVGNDQPDKGAMLALVYHNHNDGYLLIPGEDWCLLCVGGVTGATGNKIAIGPLYNVTELAKFAGLSLLMYSTPDTWLTNVKTSLKPTSDQSAVDLRGTIGPTFVYDPGANRGYFKLFLGGALSF